MRYRYLLIAVFAVFLLAACEVEINTSGEERTSAEEPTVAAPTPAPSPTPEPTPDDEQEPDQPSSWDDVIDLMSASIVRIQAYYDETAETYAVRWDGSGIVISESGHVLTTASLVTGADDVIVTLHDSSDTLTAEVLGSSGCDDLAVIQVTNPTGLVPVSVGSAGDLQAGAELATIGFPLEDSDTASLSLEFGLVQNLNQSLPPLPSVIQHDGGLSDGLEGGALVDPSGNVYGLSVYNPTMGEEADPSLGLAIPMDYVNSLVDLLTAGQNVRWLGVTLIPNDFPEIYDVDYGVLVSHVAPDSPAAAIGIRAGDLITELGSETIQDYAHLCATARQFDEGDAVDIGIVAIEEGWLQYLGGTFVYGDPDAGVALEVLWSEEHEAAFDDDDRTSEQEAELSESGSLLDRAINSFNPPQSELAGPMTFGLGIGTADVHLTHWVNCEGDWFDVYDEVISLGADIWIDEPRIGEPNPIYITLQSSEHDVEGSFIIISGAEDEVTGEYISYWDIEVDGIFFAGELVNESFDPLDAGGYIWSTHLDDPCSPSTSSSSFRAPAMLEGAIVAGYIGTETAEIIIFGSTWDGMRDFLIEIEAEMVSWDELQ
jgi:S1-C subfamily serine protease